MKSCTTSQRGFAHVILVVFLALVIAGAVGFAIIANKNHKFGPLAGGSGGPGGKSGNLSSWTAGCKSSDRVNLTHMPMDLSDVATIQPMGLTAGAHVTPIDHLYFYPKSQQRDAAPVYAMADGYIKDIQERTQNVDSGTAKQGEFHIVIQHSCQTLTYFDLVTSLDPAIEKAFKGPHLGGLNIPVKAGQVIGRIGGQSLDTAVYNMNLTLPGFIHPDMYLGEPWKIHTDDFFSYFSGADLAAMLAMDARKIKPYSGKIDYDQPGKLIGNWFVEGTNGYAGPAGGTGVGKDGHGYWDGHLSVHYDPIDGKTVVVSVGEFGPGGQPQAFGVTGNTPDPAGVSTATGLVKYELVQKPVGISVTGTSSSSDNASLHVMGVVLFQVQSGEKLKVELFPGKTAAQVTAFTSAAKTYER